MKQTFVFIFLSVLMAQAQSPWDFFEQMSQQMDRRMAAMMGGQGSIGQLVTEGPWDIRIDKNSVEAGGEVSLQFTVDTKRLEEFGERGVPRFSAQNGFSLKALDSSEVQIRGNRGRITAKQYTFHLTVPRKTGILSAGVLSWKIGDKEYDIFHLNNLQVQKSYDDAAVTVSLSPSKRTVYEGEQLAVTLSIHTYEHFQGNLTATSMDLGSDFIAHRADLSDLKLMPIPNAPRETKGSAKFAWISPLKSGQVSIPSFQFKYTKVGKPKIVEKKSSNGGFSMSFSSYQQEPEEVEAKTAPVKISVLPLPAQNKPQHFSGMVGNYSFSASFDKDSLQLGDALTLSIQISGDGKPGTITDPVLPDFSDFRTVPPETDIQKKISGGKVITSKNIRVFLYPKKKGSFEIPAITYSWFNPSKKRYESKTEGPWKIQVEKGESQSAVLATGAPTYAPAVKEEIESLGRDIRYIHAIQNASPAQPPLYKTPVFWILLLLPIPLYAAFGVFIRSRRKHAGNAALVRKAKAKKNLKQSLNKAKGALQKNDTKEFYAALENGLIGYISDLSNLEFRGMTKDAIHRNLKNLGVSDENIQQVLNWQERCAFARFAPTSGTVEERINALREFERLCNTLEELK